MGPLRTRSKLSTVVLALSLSLFAAGCKKKVAVTVPPPPPPKTTVVETPKPSAPTVASFEAEPSTIERGQSATLRWEVSGETREISISPGVGTVQAKGTRTVFPGNTTTYELRVVGPGGTAQMTATVNVSVPPSAPTATPTIERTLSTILEEVKDVYFDYDRSDIREDARSQLTRNADVLKGAFATNPNWSVVVEGHADERGSAEYNLGLADRRSSAAKEFLVQLGVPADRLRNVSFGKERPQCTESNESCYQSNRRAHFAPAQ